MCLEMSDYVGGQWISVRVACVHICFYIYVPISIFADSCDVWNNVQRKVRTHPGKWGCAYAEKQLLSISHTHKHVHIHFLWWMGLSSSVTTVQMARHVIKHPSAFLLPPLLTLLTTLSLSHIHTDTSPIPGTIIIYSTFLPQQSNYQDGNFLS